MPLAKKPEPVSAKPETSIVMPAPRAGGAETVGGAAHAVLRRLRGAVQEQLEVAVLAELAVVAELRLDPGQLDHVVRGGADALEQADAQRGRPAGGSGVGQLWTEVGVQVAVADAAERRAAPAAADADAEQRHVGEDVAALEQAELLTDRAAEPQVPPAVR